MLGNINMRSRNASRREGRRRLTLNNILERPYNRTVFVILVTSHASDNQDYGTARRYSLRRGFFFIVGETGVCRWMRSQLLPFQFPFLAFLVGDGVIESACVAWRFCGAVLPWLVCRQTQNRHARQAIVESGVCCAF